MAEQRIDAYPVDKMGFLTSSGLRKKSCFSVHFFIIWWQEECQVIHQVMIQTIFQQKTYYCIILPLILYQKLERKSLFQPIFKHVCKVQSPSTFKIFCYSFIEVQWQDLKHLTETETKHQLRWKRPLRDH